MSKILTLFSICLRGIVFWGISAWTQSFSILVIILGFCALSALLKVSAFLPFNDTSTAFNFAYSEEEWVERNPTLFASLRELDFLS